MQVTFNNTLLNDMFYITNVNGLGMPTTKDRSISLANGSGAFYSNTDFEQRVITLEAAMIPDSTHTIYQKLDTLKGILNPYLGEKELKFGAYPDRYLLARYSGSMNIEQLGMLQRFPISFYCSDPLFYQSILQTLSVVANTPLSINNIGTTPSSKFSINLTMGQSTIVISNTTTGKSLTIRNPANDTKLVNIDFGNGNILSQSLISNYNLLYLSGEFFELNPGVNSITINGGSAMNIKYRSAWL